MLGCPSASKSRILRLNAPPPSTTARDFLFSFSSLFSARQSSLHGVAPLSEYRWISREEFVLIARRPFCDARASLAYTSSRHEPVSVSRVHFWQQIFVIRFQEGIPENRGIPCIQQSLSHVKPRPCAQYISSCLMPRPLAANSSFQLTENVSFKFSTDRN